MNKAIFVAFSMLLMTVFDAKTASAQLLMAEVDFTARDFTPLFNSQEDPPDRVISGSFTYVYDPTRAEDDGRLLRGSTRVNGVKFDIRSTRYSRLDFPGEPVLIGGKINSPRSVQAETNDFFLRTGTAASFAYSVKGSPSIWVSSNVDLTLTETVLNNDRDVWIFYVNGVRSDRKSAENQYDAVMDALRREKFGGSLPGNIRSDFLWNPDGGDAADFAEATVQRLDELDSPATYYDVVLNLFIDVSGNLIGNSVTQAAGDVLLDLANRRISQTVVQDHVDRMRSRAFNRDPDAFVIVVAHSQGNLFANDYYQKLTVDELSRFKILSIATPSSFTAGGGAHVTDFWDKIRRSPGSRPWNTRNVQTEEELETIDSIGHSLERYYLRSGFSSRQRIVDELEEYIEGAQN